MILATFLPIVALFISMASFYISYRNTDRQHWLTYSNRVYDWATKVGVILEPFLQSGSNKFQMADFDSAIVEFYQIHAQGVLLLSKANFKTLENVRVIMTQLKYDYQALLENSNYEWQGQNIEKCMLNLFQMFERL